jgi:hypothetical protein
LSILRVPVLVTAAAIVGVVTACTADSSTPGAPEPSSPPSNSSSPTPSTTPGPAALDKPRPDHDACYRLSVDQLTQPTDESEPVPCKQAHTAQTIYVGRLPTEVDGHALAVDSDRLRHEVATACPRHLAAYVAGTAQDRDLSRFRVVWFSPTLAQADAGARWFRCDLVTFGRGDALHRQSGRIPRGILSQGGLDEYGLCATAAPGSADFERVRCGLPHSWRAVAAIGLDGGDAYPGQAAVRQDGDSECQDRVREQADFALTFTYGWEWPTRSQWNAGQHFGYCWARAR